VSVGAVAQPASSAAMKSEKYIEQRIFISVSLLVKPNLCATVLAI
jgi:hypothetical protein